MKSRLRLVLTPLLLVAVTGFIYLTRLQDAPIYLGPDEVIIGLDGHSLAATGRDFYFGRFMPLYFQYTHDQYTTWFPPIMFYCMAAVLKLRSFSEASIRLPTAIVGLINVFLTYFIGRKLFRHELLAALSAALMALTPAHFIHSRFAMDYIYPLPFMLGWLLCLLTYLERHEKKMLFAGTACLGVGVFSYIASALTMPLYLLLTFAVLLQQRRPARLYLLAASGFVLPTLVCIPWMIQHPTVLADVATKYGFYDPSKATGVQGLRAFVSYYQISDRLSVYWGFFNPRLLFFEGPMELMFSTRRVGVFLLPMAVLLPVGMYVALRAPVTPITFLLLAGFLSAPVVATLVSVNDAIYRALAMLPFACLLAVVGVEALWFARPPEPRRRLYFIVSLGLFLIAGSYTGWILIMQSRLPGAAVPLLGLSGLALILGLASNRMRLGQVIVLGLLVLIPIHFAYFYADYVTNYRVRSSLTFSGNIRGAFEEVIERDRVAQVPNVYLGRIGPYRFGGLYWRFYLVKHDREDLLARTIVGETTHEFDPDRIRALPSRSLVVNNVGESAVDALVDELVATNVLRKVALIREPDGLPTLAILERTAGR
jgi:4-amino-4-deoxy-L-arabinose transferase-like glycosyltransferase